MENNEFKIKDYNGTLVFEKGEEKFSISQTIDNDIWFSTSKKQMSLELSMGSRTYAEWQTYMVFENLMKSLVGRFILTGDNKSEYSRLPKDFIDLENKVITWHSDSGTDNILTLEYSEDIIKISITKSPKAEEHHTNVVRIRADGSEYGYYYQEFTRFFNQLNILESRLNPKEDVKEVESVPVRKLSLFGKKNKKN